MVSPTDLRTYQGRISYLPAAVQSKNGSPQRLPTFPLAMPKDNATKENSIGSATADSQFDASIMVNGHLRRSASAPEGTQDAATTAVDNDPLTGDVRSGGVCLPDELELVADSTVGRAPERPDPEPIINPPEGFPQLSDPVPDDWTVEEGRFVIIYSSLQSHLGTTLFFAPEARLNDGVAWLLLIRGDVSRMQVFNYFKAQEEGHHVDLPYVRLIPVRAFRLESFSNSTVTVDGELVRTKVSRAVVAHSSCSP